MKKLITHKQHNGSTRVYFLNENVKHWIQDWETFELGCELGLWGKQEKIEDIPEGASYIKGISFYLRKSFKFDHDLLDKMVCTQKFAKWPEFYKKWDMDGHNGVDFRTKFDDSPDGKRPVYAVMDGVVSMAISIGGASGYGKYIKIDHENNHETLYAHLDSLKVLKGQKVKAGEQIGVTDNTGVGTGAHLHFGYRPKPPIVDYNNGYKGYVDCLDYLLSDIKFV
ncbi:M23 family metallopeptidase [Candidatus Parcubacteria bacterium]|nr:M23 family metallopeptidase [Candidatus Parcubacteria bacterium]